MLFGNADKQIGEYLWIGTDNPTGKARSYVFAISSRSPKQLEEIYWSVDLYQILDSFPWIALSRADLFSGMTLD